MKINIIKQLCYNQVDVILEDSLLVNIKEEGNVNINKLTFKKKDNKYFLLDISIPRQDEDRFENFWYELEEFDFVDTSVEEVNNEINLKIKDHVIIPLCYLNINGKYYEVRNISDILNIKDALTKEEKEVPFREINYSFSLEYEYDDGINEAEMEKIVDAAKISRDNNLSLVEFINYLSNIR